MVLHIFSLTIEIKWNQEESYVLNERELAKIQEDHMMLYMNDAQSGRY